MTIEVHDDRRILKFEGKEIGFSSSERPGADRWIEFTLYKTSGDGQYVVSRIGVSNIYHTEECRIAKNGHIQPIPLSQLEPGMVQCKECLPDQMDFPLVCPEQDKTWARTFRTAEALYMGMMKPSRLDGSLELTRPARMLLEDAARNDEGIASLSLVETVT